MLSFGVFEVDIDSRELRRRGTKVRLSEQAYRLLITLIENPGSVVSREMIQQRIWAKGTFVAFDTGINKAVSHLRAALGDRASNPRFIETVPRQGYRFLGTIDKRNAPGNPLNQNGISVQPTIAPEADMAYQRGRYYWNRRTEKDLHRSLKQFESALSIQPDFALAHAGIANAHLLIGIFGLEPSHTAFRMARRAADRALELDVNLVEARTCVAEILKDYDWDWPGAEREFLRAISLRPDYSTAHHWYAHLLAILGRHSEALSQMQMARLAEPLSASLNSFFPYIYLVAGDYANATAEGIAAVELEPYSALAHWELGRAYLFAGAGGDALTELAHASKLAGGLPMWEAELGFARALTGDENGARNILNELMDRARRAYVSPFDLALCFAGLGENDLALEYLERAYQDRVTRIINIGDPEFSTLRREPRWASLMQRLQLPSRE